MNNEIKCGPHGAIRARPCRVQGVGASATTKSRNEVRSSRLFGHWKRMARLAQSLAW
jgi:hypothetical protein